MKKLFSFFSEIFIDIVIVIISVFIPSLFLLNDAFRGSKLNASNAADFGSFIGGYFGTMFTGLTLLLIFRSFIAQSKANKLNKDFNVRGVHIDRVYSYTKFHRENVMEIAFFGQRGRLAIKELFNEFRGVFKAACKVDSNQRLNLTLDELLEIAYLVFFYGYREVTEEQLHKSLGCEKDFSKILEEFRKGSYFNKVKSQMGCELDEKKLMAGRQSILGHYYRNLFHAFKYITCIDNTVYNKDEKKELARIIRAQLSTYEQALLAINAKSSLGGKWTSLDVGGEEINMLMEYELINNVPRSIYLPKEDIEVSNAQNNSITKITLQSLFPGYMYEDS